MEEFKITINGKEITRGSERDCKNWANGFKCALLLCNDNTSNLMETLFMAKIIGLVDIEIERCDNNA